jgi:hypothetical protein
MIHTMTLPAQHSSVGRETEDDTVVHSNVASEKADAAHIEDATSAQFNETIEKDLGALEAAQTPEARNKASWNGRE